MVLGVGFRSSPDPELLACVGLLRATVCIALPTPLPTSTVIMPDIFVMACIPPIVFPMLRQSEIRSVIHRWMSSSFVMMAFCERDM